MNNSINTGKKGEEIAYNYILNKGYKIIKRNFHFGKLGEIDIIAEKDNQIVFFEVKVQTGDSFGDAHFWLTPAKQKKLRKCAEGFIYVNKIQKKSLRFDAIFIDLRNHPPSIDHIENAF